MPDDGDDGIGHALKIAADLYDEACEFHGPMVKTADLGSWFGQGVVNTVAGALAPIGIPLGIGATVAATRAFNKSRDKNKYRRRSKAIRDYVDELNTRQPMAVLVPVEKKRKGNRPSENFTADAGFDLLPKFAAEDDDGMPTWVWMALVGAAGAAGYYWVSQNPELVKQYVPEWGHETVDWIAGSVGNADGTLPAEVRAAGAQVAQRAAEQGDPTARLAATSAAIQENTGYTMSPDDIARAQSATDDFTTQLFEMPMEQVMEVGQRLGYSPEDLQTSFEYQVNAAGGDRQAAEIAFRDNIGSLTSDLFVQENLVADLGNPESGFAQHLNQVYQSTGRLPAAIESDPALMQAAATGIGFDPEQYSQLNTDESGAPTESVLDEGIGASDFGGGNIEMDSSQPPEIDQATGMPVGYYDEYSRAQPVYPSFDPYAEGGVTDAPAPTAAADIAGADAPPAAAPTASAPPTPTTPTTPTEPTAPVEPVAPSGGSATPAVSPDLPAVQTPVAAL